MGPWLRPATLLSLTYSNGVSSLIPQDDLGELPFPFPDGFNICPDICFQVEGCSFLCHKVLSSSQPLNPLP